VSSAAKTETARSPAAHEELSLFHRTLAELCRAQVPLPRSLTLLRDQLRAGPLRDATDAMLHDVEAGTPLDEAYTRHREQFPPLYCSLVEAGMVSGDLPGVLEEIARHATERSVVVGRIRKALVYPMVTAGLLVVIGSLLGWFIAPRFWELNSSFNVEGPRALIRPALIVMGGLAVLGAFFAIAVGPFGGRWRMRMPIYGRLREDAERAGFAGTLALLLRREVPLAAALELSASSMAGRLGASARRAAAEAGEGAQLGELLRRHDLFDSVLSWIVESADGSGELESALTEVSTIYMRRLERSVDRVTTLIVPLAEVVLGVLVFLLAFSYMVPLFELQQRLLGP